MKSDDGLGFLILLTKSFSSSDRNRDIKKKIEQNRKKMRRKELGKQESEVFLFLKKENLNFKKQKNIQYQKEKIKREIGKNLDFPIFSTRLPRQQ